jgi:hypothetical protein
VTSRASSTCRDAAPATVASHAAHPVSCRAPSDHGGSFSDWAAAAAARAKAAVGWATGMTAAAKAAAAKAAAAKAVAAKAAAAKVAVSPTARARPVVVRAAPVAVNGAVKGARHAAAAAVPSALPPGSLQVTANRCPKIEVPGTHGSKLRCTPGWDRAPRARRLSEI